MSTLKVDSIQNAAGTSSIIDTGDIHQVLQSTTTKYTGGIWNPDTTYRTVPGSSVSFTPQKSSGSMIEYSFNFAYGWQNSSHAIQHIIFYRGSTEECRWTFAATYKEGRDTFRWIMPTWGTSAQTLYLSTRSYTNDGHEVRFHQTHYWNGAGSVQTCHAQVSVREYI